MNSSRLVEALASSGIYRDYQKAYTGAMGLPVVLRPLEICQPPLHRQPRESRFCSLMAEQSATCAVCMDVQAQLTRSAVEKPATAVCPYGLCEIAVPVKLGGRTIGFLQTGQVMWNKPTTASFQRAVELLAKLGSPLDPKPARKAFFRTRVLSKRKLQAISDLLVVFADYLAMTSNQVAVGQNHADVPTIREAKKFIELHSPEELSLGRVAEAMHTSIFSLCKLFKATTGMNFTEFVARTRIENAKQLSLNPNLRISEIAYAVGFHSLTHFNRMFREVAGQSPSSYRSHLPPRL